MISIVLDVSLILDSLMIWKRLTSFLSFLLQSPMIGMTVCNHLISGTPSVFNGRDKSWYLGYWWYIFISNKWYWFSSISSWSSLFIFRQLPQRALSKLKVTGRGLDEKALEVRNLPNVGFALSKVRFRDTEIGPKDVTVEYEDFKDTFRVLVESGQPTQLQFVHYAPNDVSRLGEPFWQWG